ncbi:MAG: BREX-1 system adenine-specific DNA-methyltransferase PglX [Planctomycetota bacterium]
MDQQTRNKLQRATQDARRLLEHEFAEQLEGTYDILPDGKILPQSGQHLDDHGRLIRRKLVDAIEHIRAGGKKPAEAVDEYSREAAFTFLNRFVALKMLEARGLLQQCVSKSDQSSGFKEFTGLAPGLAELPDKGYRLYLECLFDELSIEVKVLFDRRDPACLLWPRRQALGDLLTILNQSELEGVWDQDETIGWVYQYFNSQEERRKMREESQAPRNSRELAVRNQFFTPRYVVEFLTDNTLGRIWYEMRQGQTKLVDQCRYLVRRPTEIFLKEDEQPPEQPPDENLSQEELLKQPVHIPYRAKKDPRDLKILDPACGSGHFLLYCFDLLLAIYEEAWHDEHSPSPSQGEGRGEGLRTLREDYPTIEALRPAVPGLILRHNLHGIDIDPRCAQIAAFALWMLAQRAYNDFGLDRGSHPAIRRTNIVVAEPMPGEKDLLKEFTATLQPPLLGQLVEVIFDKMQLAGEAGSLLKIEEELREAIAQAREQWVRGSKDEQLTLFADDRPKAEQLRFDLSGITDDLFWQEAEFRTLATLRQFAEARANGTALRRELFADDAARGFAFIDLCRTRYDVALMNPPFGEPALGTRDYIRRAYADSKEDIYTAFVSRFAKKLEHGMVGVISNRTGFFLAGTKRWRHSTLLSSPSLVLLADLGDGVLDDALVEAAAYVIARASTTCIFFRLLDQQVKDAPLLDWVSRFANGQISNGTFVTNLSTFVDFPESRISYWAPPRVRAIYRMLSGANGNGLDVKFGLSTKDDYRFLRLCWEIPADKVVSRQEDATSKRPWMWLAKGGEYSLHFADIHLLANWANYGHEIASRVVQLYPYLNGDANWVLHSEVPYGRPGVTYSKRTTSGFSPRLLPPGCLISDLGCTIYAADDAMLPRVLATYGSRAFGYLLEFNVASGDSVHSGSAARHYEIGSVASVPIPLVTGLSDDIAADIIAIWRRKATRDARDETSRYFVLPWPECAVGGVRECSAALRNDDMRASIAVLAEASKSERAVRDLYGFDCAAEAACEAEFGPDVTGYPREVTNDLRHLLPTLWTVDMSEVVASTSRALGCARFISKMTFLADRRLELLCHRFHVHPQAIADALRQLPVTQAEAGATARAGCSYTFGVAVGRWDVCFASGERPAPTPLSPFAQLPVCPPGQLQNEQGLPITKDDVARLKAEGCWDYPIKFPWDGILVDDLGHALDIESRVHQVLQTIWKGGWEAVERETCETLGVRTLRDYYRKPTGFFEDHIKRYSKSRRKAPIYWQLATPSASYSVWLYYHRFTSDTFYKVLNDYVKPKLDHEQRKLDRLPADAGPEPTRSQRAEIDQQETFVAELRTFAEEIERIAPLWNPDLNDGVIINFAPLWRLVPQHKAWQKECKECWDSLVAGEYDWAHLAMHLWPERVVPKCRTDASLAIAHDLEDVFWEQKAVGRGRKAVSRKKKAVDRAQRPLAAVDDAENEVAGGGGDESFELDEQELPTVSSTPSTNLRWVPKEEPDEGWDAVIERLVAERTKPAVKAALKSLLEAPTPGGNGRGRKAGGRRRARA